MITLPTKLTTTMLRSFWVLLCTINMMILSISFVYVYNSYMYLFILLIIPIFILPGYMNPEIISKFYNVFNRIFKKIAKIVRNLILLIIYFVYFVPFKILDNKNLPFIKTIPEQSFWEKKYIENISGYEAVNYVARDDSKNSSDLLPFISWTIKSRKWSFLSLLPFIIIVSALTISDEKIKVTENTYTLF